MKKILEKGKALVIAMMVTLIIASGSMMAFAADSEIADAMSTGLEGMKSDLFALIAVVLPVGLLIFGAFFGVRKAISMLRATSGN